MSKKILVTGGCGYIGSHTMIELIEQGFEVVSADNLSNADESALDGIHAITGVRVQNYRVDLCDRPVTEQIFKDHRDISGIIHFAALKNVGDSVHEPLAYFHNNMSSLLNILQLAKAYQVPHFIFSSSCSVYGNADVQPVDEHTPWKAAESPYARTKQMGEDIVRDFIASKPEGFNAILLRYFNPAGAHPSIKIGESPRNKANNLVPIITECGIGKRTSIEVFGGDYPTRDGSCVRDFIHVMDLAKAHSLAIQFLMKSAPLTCEVFNVGTGDGVTVFEAIAAFEKASGQSLNYSVGPRRAGDVVSIFAKYDKAKQSLGWSPQYNIDDIMSTAWNWELARSK